MSTFRTDLGPARDKSVMVIGVGGLGCPAALALVHAGVGRVVLVDDDRVETSNLHRQILFAEGDADGDKLVAARRALEAVGSRSEISVQPTRFLPDTAFELLKQADVVLEGADNFATKFLTADACCLANKPVVHGAAIRWYGTAWLVGAGGRPCYRCLFEDVPSGAAQPNCNDAGIMGPVAGFVGALMADLALRALAGDNEAEGYVSSYDGRADRLRRTVVRPRTGCPLCDERTICDLDETRYTAPHCAA
jgi:molybdopterin/thiamine biosynthesis adenylyltransferase